MKNGIRKVGLVALVGAIIGVGVYGCKKEEPEIWYYLMILVKIYYVYKHQRLIPARYYAARPGPDAAGH